MTALQSNIEQDVPKLVRDQESILAEVNRSVIQPLEDGLLSLDAKGISLLQSKDSNIDGLRLLADAETVREIGGIVEYRATPRDGAGFEAFLADFSEGEFAKLKFIPLNL